MANRNKKVQNKYYNSRKKGTKGQANNNPDSKFSDELQSGEKCAPNDLGWYVIDDQVLNDAARIPYSIPVGMPFQRDGSTPITSDVRLQNYDDAMPGILVSEVMPLLGPAQDAGAPVNVAANSVYQYVRSKISGSRPYDAVDMMVYLGAMDSLYCVLTWITRLYSTVFTYHQSNRYLSRALIEAQGIDYDDLVANLSSFRAQVNILIAKTRALYLPSILPIFKRHSWMFSHYYIEGESEKDQIYMHVPAGIHHFEYDAAGAGMLRARRFDKSALIGTQGLINTLNYLINPIYADEDFNRISGDFLKAYEGNVFTLTEIPDIATTVLTYNEEVLLQFKNAKYKWVREDGDNWYDDCFSYSQDVNKAFLEFKMTDEALNSYRMMDTNVNASYKVDASELQNRWDTLSCEIYDWTKDVLLTSPHHDVTPGENMINTRLTLSITGKAASNKANAEWDDWMFGTEWPLRFIIYTFHRDKVTKALSLFHRSYERVMFLDIEQPATVYSVCSSQWPIISAFKYTPEISLGYVETSVPRISDAGRSIFEVDNYALIGHNVVSGLHTAAVLGEYNIPRLSVGR